MEYIKINTIYKRASNGDLILGEYSTPEFEYLKDNKWEATEKIDGTNMRLEISVKDKQINWYIGGKTDKAELHQGIVDYINSKINLQNITSTFILNDDYSDVDITVYGEGIGPKIQVGVRNSSTYKFVVFDVKIGQWWLKRKDVEDIASKLGFDVVPLLGNFTLEEAIHEVKYGFPSVYAEDKELIAEGIVLKPLVELTNRKGDRIITKIKYKDFSKYRKIEYDNIIDRMYDIPNEDRYSNQ